MKCKKGFTLVELMLVVIIIGILVAMVMPRLAGRTEQARESAARADIEGNLASALDLYELDNGSYPKTLDELYQKPADVPNWKGPYIKKPPPVKDPWGTPYVYKVTADGTDYEIISYGKDRVEGGGDDISNKEAK